MLHNQHVIVALEDRRNELLKISDNLDNNNGDSIFYSMQDLIDEEERAQ